MTPEILITLPKRGIQVTPSPDMQDMLKRAREGERVIWSDDAKKRLRLLIDCSILAKRHPTAEDGRKFMQGVDYEWRDQLMEMAGEMNDQIVSSWQEINPTEPICVLLYGSITKGLVKRPDNPDPSNIDIAVIGEINPQEREKLFDAIRPKRKEIKDRILSRCPKIDSGEENPGNVGVIIQSMDKLTASEFGQTRGYITAQALPLHDPAGIWAKLVPQALESLDHFRRARSRPKNIKI